MANDLLSEQQRPPLSAGRKDQLRHDAETAMRDRGWDALSHDVLAADVLALLDERDRLIQEISELRERLHEQALKPRDPSMKATSN